MKGSHVDWGRTWFTSDTHFGHANVIKYCNRPFADVETMDAMLVENWNATVGAKDEVFVLGDFALCHPKRVEELVKTLRGRIHMVWGNHDKFRDNQAVAKLFVSNADLLEIRTRTPADEVQHITLCHFPLLSWAKSHHGSWNLHGHCHGNLAPRQALQLDVGVDAEAGRQGHQAQDYRPISMADIAHRMKTVEFGPRP